MSPLVSSVSSSFGFNTTFPKIVTDRLVLHLDAGQQNSYAGIGTVWTDLSGLGNNGTLTNGPSYNSSNAGNIVFDGSNDYVVTTRNTQISGSSARTICVMCCPTTMSSGVFYSVTKIGSGTGNGRLFEILIRDNLIVGHFWGTGFTSNAASGKTLLNNYSYLSMVYNGTTVSYYVDGYFKGSRTHSLSTNNTPLYAGIKEFSSHANFIGRISSVKLYNRALTANEILQNFQALRGRYGI